MKHFTLILFLVFLCPLASKAQEPIDSAFLAGIDSLLREEEKKQAVQDMVRRFEENKLRKAQQFDLSFAKYMIRGGLNFAFDKSFINHDGYVKSNGDKYSTADYAVAGLPLATAWVLKAAGVKSQSSTTRMITANALSLAMTIGLTKGMKALANEPRPDGSDNNSMPSGHSAIAFASAAILAREYGDISPWISVGSFATAAATQYLRLRHKQHWACDLYMGAGIGLLSTSLGYFITDKLLVKDGIKRKPEVRISDMKRVIRYNYQPSGFSILTGSEFGNRTFNIDDTEVKAETSYSLGADLSWFLNQIFAVGLTARSTAGYAKVYGQSSYSADDMMLHHIDLSAKFSYPFLLGQRIQAHAFGGMRHTSGLNFTSTDDLPELSMSPKNNAELGCGIGYEAIDDKNYAIGFIFDYTHTFNTDVMPNRFCISTTWKVIF